MKRTRNLLITVIILNAVVWGATGFLSFYIKGRQDNINTLLASAEKDLLKDETLRSIKQSLGENEENLAKIDSYFITDEGVVDFIESIEGLGKESGVELSIGSVTTEPNSSNKNDFKETLRMRIETRGGWTESYNFLRLVESMPRYLEVETLTLNNGTDAGDNFFEGAGSTRDWRGRFELTFLKLK